MAEEEEYMSGGEEVEEEEEEVELGEHPTEVVVQKIPNEQRKTSSIMTKYEFTRLIAERATMIDHGFVSIIPVGESFSYDGVFLTSSLEIAEAELRLANIYPDKFKFPLYLKRLYIGSGLYEKWEVGEVLLPDAPISQKQRKVINYYISKYTAVPQPTYTDIF